MSVSTLFVENSYAALSEDSIAHRWPRSPAKARPEVFARGFDDRTLFYDCFWHMDGKRILLVGPPAYGIDYKGAAFTARPSGTRLTARLHASISVMLTELSRAPAGTNSIDVTIAGETASLPVQPNSSADLAGRKLLFSINKNNDLAWIREWVEYHARVHGTDAVILVDNASTQYEPRQILETISAVPGILVAGVPSWPYKFGPLDKAMLEDHWARFLQISSMSVILRRYGELAYGLLDCDVDELAGTHSGRSMYDLAKNSKGGLVVFRGTWIEAVGQGTRHRDYTQHLADAKAAHSPQRKWTLDPSRAWVRRLSVHPYWHWIEGRALLAKSMPKDALYWHFKGINTNWKQNRTKAPEGELVTDELLARRFAMLDTP